MEIVANNADIISNQNPSSEALMEDYVMQKPLRVGAQGRIDLWRHLETGELVILKTAHSKSRSVYHVKDLLLREARFLEDLHQQSVPGLVPFKGLLNYNSLNDQKNSSHQRSMMMLGYCDKGDLTDYIMSKNPHRRLDEDEARKILKSLVHTLKCCHALGIMHRDIKTCNIFLRSPTTSKEINHNQNFHIINSDDEISEATSILDKMKLMSIDSQEEHHQFQHVDELIKSETRKYHEELQESQYNYEVCLGDFGLATRLEGLRKMRLNLTVGTLDYMAPELIQGKYDERADIWSLGVLLHLMLTGQFPFLGHSDPQTTAMILMQDLHNVFRSNARYSHLSRSAQDLMLRMLTKNPFDRITLDEIQKHPWVVDVPPRTIISTHEITPMGNCFIPPQGVALGFQENILA